VARPSSALKEDLEASERAYETVGLLPAKRTARRQGTGWQLDLLSSVWSAP
ncbi:unnamed protein product, partial [Symbiodinium pilosum]